jgi:hypothetical protein
MILAKLRSLAVVVVMSVSLAISGSALVHAVVPHSHEGDTEVWQSLHASLNHEHKKSVAETSILVVVSVLCVGLLVLSVRLSDAFVPLLHALKRGILPYRRFD